MKIFSTLKGYNPKNLTGDIISGVIIAAMSIPIAMGYAEIAGLPAIYGLYGSVLPILAFAMFSTSPQMVFGVDAAPAAMMGNMLVAVGVTAGSAQAMALVPTITFFTALWLLLFSLLKAGKLVKYISSSVMGGFISGIAFNIIIMQTPKLLGNTVVTGELEELLLHLVKSLTSINIPSLLLGAGTLAIILILKKAAPKFPATVVMMALGALAEACFHLSQYGIALLPAVDSGLPQFQLLSFGQFRISHYLGMSLPIAIVIMAETLLSSNNFAMKDNYKIDDNSEIRTYALCNLTAAFTGCCPVSGSVSRTVAGKQFNGKTQVLSLAACGTMVLILLFCTGFIAYLPVPVLTAIVISALLGVIEAQLAVRLFKVDKTEFWIFIGAFAGVTILGTIYGVMIGVALSFISVLRRAVSPSREFLGVIPGHQRFYSLKRNRGAKPIEQVVIYRFSSSLFFANAAIFQEDIENSIQPDTKAVIVDASGVGSMDLAAADRIGLLYDKLKSRGIHFYLTEHIGDINDQLRTMGCERLLREGAVKRTISAALAAAGYLRPYPLAGETATKTSMEKNFVLSEFEWIFGDDAEKEMDQHIEKILEQLQPAAEAGDITGIIEKILRSNTKWIEANDIALDDVLRHLELRGAELAKRLGIREDILMADILGRRRKIEEKLKEEDPELLERLEQHHEKLDALLNNKRKSDRRGGFFH